MKHQSGIQEPLNGSVGTTRHRVTSVFRYMLQLADRTDSTAVRLVAILTIAYAISIGAIALSQRWIVEACRDNAVIGVLAAVGIGVFGHTVRGACHRIQTHLQGDLSDRVAVLVADETLRITAEIPTITHLEQPEYLNRIALLRQGMKKLARSYWTITNAAAATLSLLLSVALLASISPMLVSLAILAIPPMWFSRRGQRIVSAAQEGVAEIIRHEQQLHSLCITPASAKEIWAAGSGTYLSDLADRRWKECRNQERRARTKAALWQTAGWACYAAGLAGSLAVVTHLVQTGRAGLGDVILVITLSVRLRLQVSDAVGGAGEIAEARRIAAEYLWIHDYAVGQSKGHGTAPSHIEQGLVLNDVHFSYSSNEREILSRVDLSIPAGATVGIVGLNGAGKSTLIKLLLGMHQPVRGQITLDGMPISHIDPAQWYARNAAAFQEFSKFHLPVAELVGIGDLDRMSDDTAVRRSVDEAGAADLVAALPQGFRTPLGDSLQGVDLSQGQWQKLALARSLMRDAPLLAVFDEPTAALDPQAEHELFDRLASRAGETGRRHGTITILISHRFSTLHMVDQILVMEKGKVVERGTHEELVTSGGQYAALYKAQASAYV